MKFDPKIPEREFQVGFDKKVVLRDCGSLRLEPDELVTFVTGSGTEYDITRKEWGYYATPSLNQRLQRYSLRAVLVKNRVDHFFVLLVEKGNEAAFQQYVDGEQLAIVSWMDNTEALERMEHAAASTDRAYERPCPMCDSTSFATLFSYSEPPRGEPLSQSAIGEKQYPREIVRCTVCGHLLSTHKIDTDRLYCGGYVDANYRDSDGIRAAFERIIALDPDKSDNVGRVSRVTEFARRYCRYESGPPTVLDVGSGLGVFPYAIKRAGWECTAVDPDPRSVEHARKIVGVRAVCGDFNILDDLGLFDAVTFNRVLEHVDNPVQMLRKGQRHLKKDGFVYVEVPDGEMAAREGKGREEFFIDHLHVFSLTSLGLLARRAEFTPIVIERLKEPSSKYTLRAFLRPSREI